MPVEKGEKRREATENPREDDRSEDYVEWCLSEFEKTMNRPEEPAPKKSDEEPLRFVDEFIGKGTIPKKEEAEPKHEDVLRFDTGEGHTIAHEDQEAMNKPTKGSGVAAEASKIEEHKTDADERSQPTNEGTQPPHSSEGNLRQEGGRGGQEAERSREATGERSQSSEQQHQHNGAGPSQHSEASPTERPNLDHDKEVNSSAKQAADHQEEKHGTLRLSEDPQAFAEGNRELIKQGIIPEKDEAKLDDKTTLKFDENEGLTITHKDQNYKITTVEQEKIGEMELNRYKTKQGEEFLHIPRENKVAPPYETPWYALPKTTSIYLDREYQRELLKDAVDKAGGIKGIKGLQQELEKMNAHTHTDSLYDYRSGRQEGMFTGKLIPILRYVNRDLDEINKHTRAIGKGEAIKNPTLPFRLDNNDGSLLVGARLADGTLYTPEGRGPRFSYRNNDEEQRNRVAQSLTNVFGEVNTKYIHYTEHGRDRSLITTLPEIVGHVLKRAGAISGEVVKQSPDIPTFIRQGTIEMKRGWLRQVFGDEGSPNTMMKSVGMTRAADITNRLSDGQRNGLDRLRDGWDKTTYPQGAEQKYARLHELPDDIQKAINVHPRLLDSEKRMLSEDFGIETRISPVKIYSRKDGYSVTWILQTASVEDTRKFYNEIGFPQRRKQEKLADMLKNEGGG